MKLQTPLRHCWQQTHTRTSHTVSLPVTAPAPLSVALPTPAATPIAGSTCLGPQRHQRPSALSVDCFFAHPARVPCSNCKVSSLPSAHFCPAILDSAFVTSLCSLYSVCLWGVVSKWVFSFSLSFFFLPIIFARDSETARQREHFFITHWGLCLENWSLI